MKRPGLWQPPEGGTSLDFLDTAIVTAPNASMCGDPANYSITHPLSSQWDSSLTCTGGNGSTLPTA